MTKTRVIGLDIGTTHVRAAELEFGNGGPSLTARPRLVRLGVAQLPPGAVREGEVVERQTVGSAIKRLWTEQKFSHKNVVLGIGNQRVVVRDLDLPAMPIAQVRSSLPFQVADLIPVAVDDAILDYLPTGVRQSEGGDVMQGLLVAATKDTVTANTAAVEVAGLRPVIVDLSAFALSRAMARGEALEHTVAVVDVGARVTTVAVVARGVPRMIRMLPSGGQDVTEAVAAALQIPLDQAEIAKRGIGVGFATAPEHERAAEQITTVVSALIEAIRNTMVYYASSHPGAGVEHVMLTGGGSQLPGLGQYLSTATRLPVSAGQPLDNLDVERHAASPRLVEEQYTLAIALGLAMGAAA
ncbi:type IV pilus assembly protein PilM [Cellulomonas sp. KH9]|uniref:type IV pilus assembly protein PilM n=1 Tax=Cellulomonas sp. KH9 TaxID=1855324 RepID=UPI0008E33B88|nr:type IV pilus assembly protein PilM [Cellulomonas sp. KH9]SFJ96859.1 type IV pilus assembly protein PilM [Cellulomonas sp. KH9]